MSRLGDNAGQTSGCSDAVSCLHVWVDHILTPHVLSVTPQPHTIADSRKDCSRSYKETLSGASYQLSLLLPKLGGTSCTIIFSSLVLQSDLFIRTKIESCVNKWNRTAGCQHNFKFTDSASQRGRWVHTLFGWCNLMCLLSKVAAMIPETRSGARSRLPGWGGTTSLSTPG